MSDSERGALADSSIVTSRRGFIGALGGGAGAVYAASLGALSALPGSASAALARTYTTGRDILYLDGQPMGFLSGRKGGLPFVEVQAGANPSQPQTKPATVKFEPLELQFGIGMSPTLYKWVADSTQPQTMGMRKTGYVAFTGYDGTEGGRLTFHDAVISEVKLPKLDAASKDPAAIAVVLTPAFTQMQWDPAKPIKHTFKPPPPKKWMASAFRLNIDGIAPATATTPGIAFEVESHVTTVRLLSGAIGEFRFPTSSAAGIDSGALTISVREDHVRQFLDWFDRNWGAKGSPEADLRTATLDFLEANLQTVMGTVTFKNVGVARVDPLSVQTGDALRRVRIELYASSTSINLDGFA